jgi:chromosome segregation ATPase
LNTSITKNSQNKQQFTGFVLTKLQEIHEKIKAIMIKIKEIKNQVDTLEGQVNQNNSGIQDKDAEIAKLTQQLQQLTSERDSLTSQLANTNNSASEKTTLLQQQIDQNEAKLRELEAQNATLVNEKDTLNKELASRGDVQGQHAQEIQKLSEENKSQIEKMQQENVQQMQELQKQIADKESQLQANAQQMQELQKQITDKEAQLQSNAQQIQDLQKQIAEKDKQISDHQSSAANTQQEQQQNASAIADVNNKLAQLEQERNALQQQNDDLIQRIIAATNAINSATTQIEKITDEVFFDKKDKDISRVIEEIEASLQEITNTIEGKSVTMVSNSAPSNSAPSNSQQKNRNVNVKGITINLNDLMNNLMKKNKDVVKNTGDEKNKYKNAYKYINDTLISSPAISDKDLGLVVENAMKGIDFTSDGSVRGGYVKVSKKHKKYGKKYTRKQKGGFTWGKYKKTTTNPAPTTKIMSSLVSSRKKYKMNRGRGVTKRHK